VELYARPARITLRGDARSTTSSKPVDVKQAIIPYFIVLLQDLREETKHGGVKRVKPLPNLQVHDVRANTHLSTPRPPRQKERPTYSARVFQTKIVASTNQNFQLMQERLQ